jgi:glycosyltransferase involved in cell wall biosynthesis
MNGETVNVPEDSVCLSYIHPADVSSYFMESVVELLDYDKKVVERISLTSGPRIASARNTVVREFLANRRSEWLVMVDADMVFAPDAIEQLVAGAREKNVGIVGALCYGCTATGVMNPTLFRLVTDEQGKKFELYERVPPPGMVKVDATGTGMILIHRDILLDIGDRWGPHSAWPWFHEGEMKYGPQMVEYGEDIGFCIRAHLQGHDIFVNTAVVANHHKPIVVTPKHYHRYLRDVKNGVTADQRLDEAMLFNNPPEAKS